MDTNETYVKMCEKAEEIQESRKLNDREWEAGDWGYWPENGDINVMYMGEYEPGELGKGHIWLPRQDQLQEMVNEKYKTRQIFSFIMLADFWVWFTENMEFYLIDFTSMEQLWLAFVMKFKYNKTWNGESWLVVV